MALPLKGLGTYQKNNGIIQQDMTYEDFQKMYPSTKCDFDKEDCGLLFSYWKKPAEIRECPGR
jgi:hypothetical protein